MSKKHMSINSKIDNEAKILFPRDSDLVAEADGEDIGSPDKNSQNVPSKGRNK